MIDDLKPMDAILSGKFSALHLESGDWPLVGRRSNWGTDRWPYPEFVWREEGTGRIFLVRYDEKVLSREVSTRRVAENEVADGLPRDSLMGAGFVEQYLPKLIEDSPSSE